MKMSREMFPIYALKGLQWTAWGICAIACGVAAMLLLTPLVLMILTLGMCVMHGHADFVEYALTSFQMAFFPLLIAGLCALCGYGLRLGTQRVQEQAKRAKAEQLDLERMRNLAKQNASRRLAS